MQEKSQVNNLALHLKEQQTNPRVNRRKEIIKIILEINCTETKRNTKDQWNQELVLEKVNKIDKSFTRLMKKKIQRTQINKINNGRGDTDITKIQEFFLNAMNNYMPTNLTT